MMPAGLCAASRATVALNRFGSALGLRGLLPAPVHLSSQFSKTIATGQPNLTHSRVLASESARKSSGTTATAASLSSLDGPSGIEGVGLHGIGMLAGVVKPRGSLHDALPRHGTAEVTSYYNDVVLHDSALVLKPLATEGGELRYEEDLIAGLCEKHLAGDLQSIRREHPRACVRVERILKGLTNHLHKCLVVEPAFEEGGITESVLQEFLFRIYGPATDDFFAREHEVKVFQAFSDAGAGPRLLYMPPQKEANWRIEEFYSGAMPVPATALAANSHARPLHAVLKLMASIHESPLLRSQLVEERAGEGACAEGEIKILSNLARWSDAALRRVCGLDEALQSTMVAAKLCQIVLLEIRHRRETMHCDRRGTVADGFRVSPCHNDIQPENILEMPTGEIVLIDSEYGGANFPGLDFANTLNEVFTLDYDTDRFPGFLCELANFPSEGRLKKLAEVYIGAAAEARGGALASGLDDQLIQEHADEFVLDALLLSAASHLQWKFWSDLKQASFPEVLPKGEIFSTKAHGDYRLTAAAAMFEQYKAAK